MCPSLLGDARLYETLLRFDTDIAALARERGCECGGVLHSARYSRKPRGPAIALPPGYDRRDSFCCADEGCRKRTTPESLRFLGRKVYLAAVVVVISAMKHGLTARRFGELRRLVGVSRETVARWRAWWTEMFPATAFWRIARAQLSEPVSAAELPSSLLERFDGGADGERGRLVQMLNFIKPVSSRTAGNSASKPMVS